MNSLELKKAVVMISEIKKLGKRLHRCYENDCNGFHSEKAQKRNENISKRLELKITASAGSLGFKVYIQSDPRGGTVYLYQQKDIKKDENINCQYNAVGVFII